MKISLKNYQKIRLGIVVILSFIISQCIVIENYIIPIFCMIIGSLVLLFLRRRVKEIIADERDYTLAGKSALYAIQIFSWIAAISMFLFYYFKNINDTFEIIAQTLGFSICFLMILYSLIFSFLTREGKFDKKLIIYTLFITILIGFFISLFFIKVTEEKETPQTKNNQEQTIKATPYKIEKVLENSCIEDKECETPGEYLIRSNCPFTSKCIEKKCTVICPNF